MTETFNLEQYMSRGIEHLIKSVAKATFTNPGESAFLSKFALAASRAKKLRARMAQNGEPIPAFLIASISSECNLHCEGCYARANSSCGDKKQEGLLSAEEWGYIFDEAGQLGICFILLAGGEPLMRSDIIGKAAGRTDIVFPVFTNGTLLKADYLALFDASRNLVPILSIEGDARITDARRGSGVYAAVMDTAEKLRERGILFGASITVTGRNLEAVTSDGFLAQLREEGFKVALFVEYVPISPDTANLTLTEEERRYLAERINLHRRSDREITLISFPGDEASSGGCLAAGRGFFHINTLGGAEPCPFSPYSDTSLKTVSLRDALQSPLFHKLQSGDILLREHEGGCVLHRHEEAVKELLKG